MSQPVELALPCRLISLQLSLAPESGLSSLENLVARAVLIGRDTTEQLAKLFRLSERLVGDVVTTMWEKGFLVVDLEEGTLDLSESARVSLTKKGEVSSQPRTKPQKFVFEPLSRVVLIDSDRSVVRWAGQNSVKVRAGNVVSAEDVPEGDLVLAVQKAMDRERARGNRDNVLRVGFGNRLLRPPDQVRWIHARARVGRDPRGGRFFVTIEDDRWDEASRLRLESEVDRLLEEDPDSEFSQQLRLRAVDGTREPETVATLFARLTEAIADVAADYPQSWADSHVAITSSTARIEDGLFELRQGLAEASITQNEQAQDWALGELIGECRTQLVLVIPDITYAKLNPWLDELRTALRRGVRLVVIWGRGPDDTLPDAVETALRQDLGRRFPGQVIVPSSSRRTDACLVIQDDERVLVTSHSVLGDTRSTDRIGCVIEAADGAEGPAAVVVDLLLWCLRILPRDRGKHHLLVHQADFHRPPPSPRRRRPMVGGLPDPLAEGTNAAGVASYRAGCQRVLMSLREEHQDLTSRCSVHSLIDGDLRPAFWNLLETAQRRLVIADNRVDPRVADPAMAGAIRECCGRAAVQLIHPKPARPDPEDPFSRLNQGINRVPVRFGRPGARVVVADGSVLIGSFSPLSDGEGRLRKVGERRSQVGILIQDEGLSTEMAAQLHAVPNARLPEALPPPDLLAEALDLALLEEVGRTQDGHEIAELIRSRPPESGDYWTMLEGWKALGVPEQQLRPAVASVLTLPPIHVGDDEAAARLQWVGWLIRDAWDRRSFVEAALLAPLDATESALAATATLAAALEIGPLASAATELALLLTYTPDFKTGGLPVVAAAGALADCLIWSDDEGLEAAKTLSSSLPPAWQRFVRAVDTHFRVPEGGLPQGIVVHEQARLSQLAGLERERGELVEKIDRLEAIRSRFSFREGRPLYHELLAPQGLLTVIRAAAREGLPAVAGLKIDLPGDVQDYLDRLIHREKAVDVRIEGMIWSDQLGFLRTIESIVASCRRIREQLDTTQVVLFDDLPPGQAAIAKHVEQHWEELFTEADSLGSSLRAAPLELMAWLEPVVAWARGRR